MDKEQVRATLERLMAEQLVGPGSEDEALAASPSDIYLTGILWPRETEIGADEDDAGASEVAGKDSESVEAPVPGYRAIRPCSIGLTFEVAADAAVTVSLGSTSRYVAESVRDADAGGAATKALAANRDEPDRDDSGKTVVDRWRRRRLGYLVRIPGSESRPQWRTENFELPDGTTVHDGSVAMDVRRRPHGDRTVVTVTLINTASGDPPRELRDGQLLFQSQLVVHAVRPHDAPAIYARPAYPFADDDEDQLTNLLLYREVQEFAVAHGVAAEWPADTRDAVANVETTWLPRARVQGMSPDGHRTVTALTDLRNNPLAAAVLADASNRTETCAALDEFCGIYAAWIVDTLESRAGDFRGEYHRAALQNLGRCRKTLGRLEEGVRCLRDSDVAWEAFMLANRAMDRQAMFPAKGERRRPLVWRPFQLAFVLLVIPGLVNPADQDRDTMDLLWFPTGGGKTEAYLALTAFEIFRRRLTSAERRSMGGLDVLMRYTLRLLTIQQFQRAAALIAACEMLRRDDPERLGQEPVSLGLYVGGESTPNRLDDAVERLAEEAAGREPSSTPRQLLNCPVCGAGLQSSAYRIDENRRWMDVSCRAEGCEVRAVALPVLTVDEAIYAHPPSLLIGTVDKFAQLPRNENVGALFGAGTAERLGLIIQDELHLISGPLGSITGLYESCIDMLCTAGDVRPKIIGSTATIGRARRQVRALFDRDVLQFPPPGFDATDSFFAVRDEDGPDRIYRGVATAGRSPKFALQALIASLMQSVHQIRESGSAAEADVDPYWTCVGYFNSLRELGGAHVLMLDDVRRQMAFLAGRSGATRRPMEEPPLELSSRVPSRQIPEYLAKLNRSIESDDVFEGQPPDAVLASNMISVGVDVPRLGLMAVAGQPKSTAEYIQATSRVGRGIPGLVVTLYNFGRPRDLSHFEHFQAYHAALYRSVEATSVTPWAPRARDKALHAILAAIVRHRIAGMKDDGDAIGFDPGDPEVQEILEYLGTRAEQASEGLEGEGARSDLAHLVEVWRRRSAEARAAGTRLVYWEKKTPFNRNAAPHLMRSAEQLRSPGSSAWATPNSMREVEPSTAFVLRRIRPRTP
jgi:hypothetical protein